MKKVFLGGTCNGSRWRDNLIPKLAIAYFNPVVDRWKREDLMVENLEKDNCDFSLYVITPKMKRFYVIAEVVDDSNKRPEKTLLCILDEDGETEFSQDQKESLRLVKELVSTNGGKVLGDLDEVADYLNRQSE